MHKPEPKEDEGLWFKYPRPQRVGFWMKNVPYDLDVIVLDGNMRVIEILTLKANDETSRFVSNLCHHALELKAGSRNHISLGDIVVVSN